MSLLAKHPSAFIETLVDDEIVIVSLDQGSFFSLKDTGRAIWEKIDGNRSRDAILAELQAEYDAPQDVLERDLDSFLDEITAAGFVRRD